MAALNLQPPNLAQYQKEFLYCKQRNTVVEASTKTGKTFSHIWWLFERSLGFEDGKKILDIKEGMEFWWVAPIYQQAKIAFNRLKRKVATAPGFTCNLSELTITTPLGSIIRFKSADKPDGLFGEDVHAAVFDEFTRAKPEAWDALRSTVTHTRAPVKFIGNYKGRGNWGHQLSAKAVTDPEMWAYFKVTAYDAVDAGILSEDEVEQARKDLTPLVFQMLYLAEGDADESRLILDKAIEDLLTNTGVEVGEKAITADIAGLGSDKFVVFVWEGFRITQCFTMDKSDPQEVERVIRQLAEEHGVRHSRIVYDADGLGHYLKGYLKGAIPFHNGGKVMKVDGQKEKNEKDKDIRENYKYIKDQCYFHMAKRINSGGMYFDCEIGDHWTDIVEEMEVIKNGAHGIGGKLRVLTKKDIKQIIGRSPDYTDALMMRERLEFEASNNWWDNVNGKR